MDICVVCGRRTKNPTWCSEACGDVSEGEAPRRSGNPNAFYVDSPHKKQDPGNDYKSNEEIRVYGE